MININKVIQFVFIGSSLLSGCSNFKVIKSNNFGEEKGTVVTKSISYDGPLIEIEEVLETSSKKSPTKQTVRLSNSSNFNLNFEESKYQFWLRYYKKNKNKKRFIRQLKRGEYYKSLVESIFISHGLPKELYFVGLIESGYSMNARSHAKAVGPWQFMKKTGKHYKLKVNWYTDERKNIVKATHASANYFKDLYNIFGSWELALCAYNAGEYRIIRAIRKGNSRDYKVLVKKKLLPKETIYYIPKVLAAQKLSIKLVKSFRRIPKFNLKNYKNIKLRGISSLKKLGTKLRVSYNELKKLNPEYVGRKLPIRKTLQYLVPISVKRYSIVKYTKPTKRKYKKTRRKVLSTRKLARGRTKTIKTYKRKKIFVYKVKKGDSLFSLQRLFKFSLLRIKQFNKFTRNRIYTGQRIKFPIKEIAYHKVKRGDSLTKIAGKYNVSIRFLKKINSLRGDFIMLGQKITIPQV